MTAGKLITGRDAPLSNMEMTLWSTYNKVKVRLEHQKPKPRGKRK
jgi:hypothetical protein